MFGYLYNKNDLYENIIWILCIKIDFRCINDHNLF